MTIYGEEFRITVLQCGGATEKIKYIENEKSGQIGPTEVVR
jgi:hypothetical protein